MSEQGQAWSVPQVDATRQLRPDLFDSVEYAASSVLGYTLLAAALIVGVISIF